MISRAFRALALVAFFCLSFTGSAFARGDPPPTPTPQQTCYCVGDYTMGDNPGSGCCWCVTPNPGVTCTDAPSAEPPQSNTITCTGPDGSGVTYTVTVDLERSGGTGPTSWQCNQGVETFDPPPPLAN